MSQSRDDARTAPPTPDGSEAAEPRKQPYEAPTLVEYGDIATLTQTGGLTKMDTGTKKQRIG